ncbi:MAG: hypothetical protein WC236_05080 [Gallionellaceae bacterium]|jgi:hypothetical protein
MNRRYAIYFGLIALLIAANFVRVWLDSGKGAGEQPVAHGKAFLPEDFRLRVDVPVTGELQRNLFQPPGAPRMTPAHAKQTRAKSVTQSPLKLEKNETELAANRLAKLKLLGVVFRAGKGQAYLGQDKESVIAFAGDTVFGQFIISKIFVDAVELRDLKTNTIRRIPVSGK